MRTYRRQSRWSTFFRILRRLGAGLIAVPIAVVLGGCTGLGATDALEKLFHLQSDYAIAIASPLSAVVMICILLVIWELLSEPFRL